MKISMVLILIGFVITGCSSVAQADKVVPNMPSSNPGIASIATEGLVTEEITAVETTSSSTPIVMQVNLTPILLVPIQGNTVVPVYTPTPISLEGWKIFTNASLGIAVNYPPDWSVTEQSDGATFTSPQGTTILLKTGGTNSNEIKIGNRRCLSRINAYNLTADVCVDTASFSYSAAFAFKSANGASHNLTLTMTTRNTADVFEGMFNSVRPAK